MTADPAMCNETVQRLHGGCYACGDRDDGLGLCFRPDGESVVAEWSCDGRFESYPGIIHGGIIATILDSAMTNCLLMKGIVAVTAELSVRYHESLKAGSTSTVRAAIVLARPPLFRMEAELVQGGVLSAKAQGKFMQTDSFTEKRDVQ